MSTLEAREARRTPRSEPPPPVSTPGAPCASAYNARLSRLAAEAGERMDLAFALVRRPSRTLPGHWIVVDEGKRTQLRDAQGRIVDGERVCAEQVEHARRIRCLRWEPYEREAAPIEPDLALTGMSPREEKLRDFYDDIVTDHGAGPEFQGNGRYTAMTDRLAHNLPIYMGQPAHPALCNGAAEMLGYLAENLTPLKKRVDAVYAQEQTVRQLALEMVGAVAMREPASLASLDGASFPTTVPVALPAAAGAAPLAVADLAPAPIGLRLSVRLTREVAARVLKPAAIARLDSETTALAAIASVLDSLRRATATIVSPPLRLKARLALRTIELLSYAELTSERYRELDEAVLGTLTAAQRAQAESCTCPE